MRVRERRLSPDGCGRSAKAAERLCGDRVTFTEAGLHGKGRQRLETVHNSLMLRCIITACVSDRIILISEEEDARVSIESLSPR